MPKREGGLGLLQLRAWNTAFMGKHFSHIHEGRESLWVKWVHCRYLDVVQPAVWTASRRDSPLIKAIIASRDKLTDGAGGDVTLPEIIDDICASGKYKVKKAYDLVRDRLDVVGWNRVVWDARATPRHAFILWMATLGRLSTYDRMAFLGVDPACKLCLRAMESHSHLFFECSYSKEIWGVVCRQFKVTSRATSIHSALTWLGDKAIGKGRRRCVRLLTLSATVYYIWFARNAKVFDNNSIPAAAISRLVIGHVFRLLHEAFPGRIAEDIW